MWSGTTASSETSATSAGAWSLVGVIWLGMVLNYVDRQVAFSIFPVLRSQLAFTESQLGLVGSIFIWTYSLVNPFAGYLADRVRRESLMTASVVLWSLAALGTATSQSPFQFLLWRAAMGITEAVYVPCALSLIGMAHPGPTRSRALALYSTGQMTGIVAGGWFGGWMAPALGWRAGFVVLAGVGFAFAPFFRRMLGSRSAVEVRQRVSGAGSVFSSRCYLALTAAFIMLCALLWMVYAWLPDFLFRRYGLTLAQAGLVATVYTQSGSVAGLLAGGYFADRLAKRASAARFYIAAAGLALAAPCAALTFSGPDLPILRICAFGFGFASALMVSNVFAAAYDVLQPARYGFGGGALNMAGGLSGGAAMFVAGYWKDLGAGGLTPYAAAVAVAAAATLAVVARTRFLPDRRRAGLP